MDQKFEENVVKLAGLVLSLKSRIRALEKLCFVLGAQQGFDLEKMQQALREMAAAEDEKLLLQVGDEDPRAAELADVLGRLKERKEDGAE